MEILLAIHDKKILSNLQFHYVKEDKLFYPLQKRNISLQKSKKYFPVPFYELRDKNIDCCKNLKEMDKVQISFTIANKIDFSLEIPVSLKIDKIILSSYFLNQYYRETKSLWVSIYEQSFTNWIQRKDLKYNIGFIKNEEIYVILSNCNKNIPISISSFIRQLEMQEKLFEHFLIC